MENSDIATKMTEALVKAGGTDKSVKFDFGDDGQVFASGTEATTENNEADCTISVSKDCLLYTSPSPRDRQKSRMPSSA